MATLADLMIRIGIDADRVHKGVGKVVDSVDRSFGRLNQSAGAAIKTMSGLSGVVPLAAGAAGGVMALGTSVAAAGAAAGVFGAVLGSTVSDVSENATKVEDLTEKVRLYGRQAAMANKYGLESGDYAKKQSKALLELEARLSLLPPAERKATMAFIDMKGSWADFVDDNKPQTFGILQRGYALIGNVVKRLQPLYDIGAKAAGRLLGKMEGMVEGGFIERLAARAGPALESLMSIMFNVGTVIGKVFGKMGDAQGQGMLEWIEQLTARWAAWAKSSEQDTGINKFVDYMTTNGPLVMTILSNLATTAGHIWQALSPLAPISAAVAMALSTLIAAVPPGVITALVAGFIAWNAAMKVKAAVDAIATARQWALNSAMLASPTTWIVAGILLLVGVIVYLATKTRFFQTVWEAVWGFLKAVGAWFAGPFANFFVSAYNKVLSGLTAMRNGFMQRLNAVKVMFTSLKNHAVNAFNGLLAKGATFLKWINSLPGRMRSALSNLFSPLWSGFKSALNRIISGWNNLSFTVGGGSFAGISIPSATLGTPNIPYLAEGGIVTQPTLAVIGEGRESEAVVPLSKLPEVAGRNEKQPVIVEITPGGERDFRRWINKSIRVKGALRTSKA